MIWQEVRQHFPQQWLLVEATRAHSEANHRVLDDLAVLGTYPSGKQAMNSYLDVHRAMPQRELFVLHTSREELVIEERRWLGIRGATGIRTSFDRSGALAGLSSSIPNGSTKFPSER